MVPYSSILHIIKGNKSIRDLQSYPNIETKKFENIIKIIIKF